MTRKLHTGKDAPPLYIQLKNELKKKIDDGTWMPGDKITSELELCSIYDVSRTTVRDAINELVWEKYLVRHRAKGTFVLDHEHVEGKDYNTYVKSSIYELNEMGQEVHTYQAEVKRIKADKTLSQLLGADPESTVYMLSRLRKSPGTRPFYSRTWWTGQGAFPEDPAEYMGSFYTLLEGKGICVTTIKEYLEATLPEKAIAEALGIQQETPILKRVRKAEDTEGLYTEYSECYYIGEDYRYHIELVGGKN
ncbi:GntR family transcriptional regulator (plasmid) [Rossellomorea sp. FS2]|uniref:GntR family transcriptional regulator n=1 Tax=Rossellomorea sp. FS2 TaxID=3391447 RepID=UPI003A4DE244